MKPLAAGVTPLVQRAAISDDEELQMKQVAQQSPSSDPATVEPSVEATIERSRVGGQSLPQDAQVRMERAFGADFSGVRIHTNDEADRLNRSLEARAFTTGHDLFFRRGEYNPLTSSGQQLIAHELTHVVQQNKVLCKKKDLAQGDSLAARVAHHIHSVQGQVIQGAFDLKNLPNLISDNTVRTGLENDFNTALQTYIDNVGEAKFQDLVNVKKLDGKALMKYSPLILKTFEGAGDKTMKHVAAFDGFGNGEIKGTHDEATFIATINKPIKCNVITGMKPVPQKTEEHYNRNKAEWDKKKGAWEKEDPKTRKPFTDPEPVKPEPTPIKGEENLTTGEITKTDDMKLTEVKTHTYQLRDPKTGKLSTNVSKKTTIKDLVKDSKKWRDFANQAIWDSVKAGNLKFGQWQGIADKVKVEGYYRGGDEVETFYCIE